MKDGSRAARPAGVRFAVDAGGDARVRMPGPARTGREVMVTSEVGGNAQVPTRAPILRVRAWSGLRS